MDDVAVKQLTRQLKLLNFWITLFGTIMIIGFAITAFLIYKVVTFTEDVSNKVTTFQSQASQTLDVQKQLCDSKSVGSLLHSKTDACN